MNETNFLRCACQKCGGHIEFPEEGVGRIVQCPHCQQTTELSTSTLLTPVLDENKRFRRTLGPRLILIGSSLVLMTGIVGFFFLNNRSSPPAVQKVSKPVSIAVKKKLPGLKISKSSDNLRSSAIQLEKSHQGNLVYAVGSVENESDDQRFGVKIELELWDDQNSKIGTATDYISVIEPRASWRFRALVTEPRAMSAKIARIKEE